MIVLKEKFKKYKHFCILLYYIVILIFYSTYNKVIVPKYFMHCAIDDYIPFIKEMIIPYVIWYPYIVLPFVYFGFNDKESFYNLSAFIFSGMTICFIIFAIFPNGQNLRPTSLGSDCFSKIIKLIYNIDRPVNSAPSMHAMDSIAVHAAISNSKALEDKKFVKIGSFILMILIIMSTVMIKQHSIIDVLYGIALSIGLYIVIYKLNILRAFKSIRVLRYSK